MFLNVHLLPFRHLDKPELYLELCFVKFYFVPALNRAKKTPICCVVGSDIDKIGKLEIYGY